MKGADRPARNEQVKILFPEIPEGFGVVQKVGGMALGEDSIAAKNELLSNGSFRRRT